MTARVSAPVKMASVNKFSKDFTVTKMPEQLIYSDSFYSYLNAGPRATPHWVGSASGTGLRDPESRDPVPDPETLPFTNVQENYLRKIMGLELMNYNSVSPLCTVCVVSFQA